MMATKKFWLKLLWFIASSLCIFMIVRGLWALAQPWGVTSQKLFALGFFFLLFLFSLYQFIQNWLTIDSPLVSERFRHFVLAMGSLTFVLGSVFVFAIGDSTDRIWAVIGIAFFGLGTVLFVRRLFA